jgi:23S rRNA pseudouridine955/2504/2580 synthase
MINITVSTNEDRQRLDRFLRKYLSAAPLSLIYKMIRKDIKVNGRRVDKEYMLAAGDVIGLYIGEERLAGLVEKKQHARTGKSIEILYEDEDILAVSKPFGLLVHGNADEKKDTLANRVIDYLIETGSYVPRIERTFVPSPVHRLDRNTTGIVLFGKNAQALRTLSVLFRENAVRRFYTTIVAGTLTGDLHLSGSLARDESQNRSFVLKEGSLQGKRIETIARPLYAGEKYSIAEVELITGRSHQIRAHMQAAGYPLVCDRKYGDAAVNRAAGRKIDCHTQLLHAGRVTLPCVPEPLPRLSGLEVTAAVPLLWKDIQIALFGKEIIPHGHE